MGIKLDKDPLAVEQNKFVNATKIVHVYIVYE